MKALLLAAVVAVSATPVMAGNGWNYGSSWSAANCKPASSYSSRYDNYDSWSNRSSYGSGYSSKYGSRFGAYDDSRFGSGSSHRWNKTHNVWPTRFNSTSSYYDDYAPAVRNTRLESQFKNNLTFSPWSPTRTHNHSRYGY